MKDCEKPQETSCRRTGVGRARRLITALAATALATTSALAEHSPSAVFQPPLDRIVTFVVGNDGHLYDKYYNGGWIWESQGNPPVALAINSPSAVFQPPLDRILTFVVGNNGHLYDKYWNGQQWVWEDQGNPPGSLAINSPSAVFQPPLDLIVTVVVG